VFNAHITIKELPQRTVNSNARFDRTIHALILRTCTVLGSDLTLIMSSQLFELYIF